MSTDPFPSEASPDEARAVLEAAPAEALRPILSRLAAATPEKHYYSHDLTEFPGKLHEALFLLGSAGPGSIPENAGATIRIEALSIEDVDTGDWQVEIARAPLPFPDTDPRLARAEAGIAALSPDELCPILSDLANLTPMSLYAEDSAAYGLDATHARDGGEISPFAQAAIFLCASLVSTLQPGGTFRLNAFSLQHGARHGASWSIEIRRDDAGGRARNPATDREGVPPAGCGPRSEPAASTQPSRRTADKPLRTEEPSLPSIDPIALLSSLLERLRMAFSPATRAANVAGYRRKIARGDIAPPDVAGDDPIARLIGTRPENADARFAELGGDEDVIPEGHYCYTRLGRDGTTANGLPVMKLRKCPYWAADPDQPEQASGYCALLKSGDWEGGFGLLWDQVKSCTLNPGNEEDEDLLHLGFPE